jgi:hypothetical protein
MKSSYLGKKEVTISDVPYTQKFGNDQFLKLSLSDYVDKVKSKAVNGGEFPWYLFEGIQTAGLEAEGSPMKWETCPTPDIIQFAMEKLSPNGSFAVWGSNNMASRAIFQAAQWGVGAPGSGAPVHFHNPAWNALLYGAKYWLLYPPHDRIMSNTQINQFVRGGDMERMKSSGARMLSCVQTAGDILVVPESWAHGVLNIQDSVAVATESMVGIWRQSSTQRLGKRYGFIRK